MAQDSDLRFGERMKNESAKLKEMNFREKREYIWEYYKIHIVVGILALILIGSLINTWFINPPKDCVLFIAWSSGFETDEHMDALSKIFEEKISDNPDRETVIISSFIAPPDDPSMIMAAANRLIAMLSAGEIDVFILDRQGIDEYANAEFIVPADGLLQEIKNLDENVYNKIIDKTVTSWKREDGNPVSEHIYGIELTDCPLFEGLGFYEQELFFCVSVTMKEMENAAIAVAALYE